MKKRKHNISLLKTSLTTLETKRKHLIFKFQESNSMKQKETIDNLTSQIIRIKTILNLQTIKSI
jgi:hypothetical protein